MDADSIAVDAGPRDRIAQVYLGLVSDEETQAIARERINWICRAVAGQRVLDVGCSEGIVEILLARDGLEVVGVDLNAAALDYGRSLLAREPEEVQRRVTFLHSDGASLSLDRESFDSLILAETLEHTPHPDRLVSHLTPAVREGGRVVATTPFGYHPDPDHKTTFTLSSFLPLFRPFFAPVEVEVLCGYIIFVAERAADPEAAWAAFERQTSLVALTERALVESQADLQRRLDAARASRREALSAAERLKKEIGKRESDVDSVRADMAAKLATAQKTSTSLHKRIARLEADLAAAVERAEAAGRSAGEQDASQAERLQELERARRWEKERADRAAGELEALGREAERLRAEARAREEELVAQADKQNERLRTWQTEREEALADREARSADTVRQWMDALTAQSSAWRDQTERNADKVLTALSERQAETAESLRQWMDTLTVQSREWRAETERHAEKALQALAETYEARLADLRRSFESLEVRHSEERRQAEHRADEAAHALATAREREAAAREKSARLDADLRSAREEVSKWHAAATEADRLAHDLRHLIAEERRRAVVRWQTLETARLQSEARLGSVRAAAARQGQEIAALRERVAACEDTMARQAAALETASVTAARLARLEIVHRKTEAVERHLRARLAGGDGELVALRREIAALREAKEAAEAEAAEQARQRVHEAESFRVKYRGMEVRLERHRQDAETRFERLHRAATAHLRQAHHERVAAEVRLRGVEKEHRAVLQSEAYRLGHALVDGVRRPGPGLARLPGRIAALARPGAKAEAATPAPVFRRTPPPTLPVDEPVLTPDEQFARLRADLAHFRRLTAYANTEAVVFMFSGTTFVQKVRANRPIRLTTAFLEKGIPVLFNYHRWKAADAIPDYDGGPLLQTPIDFTEKLLPELAEMRFGKARPIFVVSYPYPVVPKILNRFAANGWMTVYDCRDDWEEFHKVGQAKWFVPAVEKYIVKNCDVVCCVSKTLQAKMQAYGDRKRVELIPNGADPSFRQPDYSRRPVTPRKVGYFGHLTPAWFDWDSLRRIAEMRPALTFELIGHSAPADLQLPGNVVLLGPKSHPEINAIAAEWSAAIIAFKCGALADAVDPIKIYEYLALELPVVSFRMPQIDDYPYTTTVETVEAFCAALDEAVETRVDAKKVERFLGTRRWEDRADNILKLVGEVAGTRPVEKSFH